jgi:serine/threonine protein kinase
VYLALDHETGEHVALKKLFKLDQRSVARFKREFRALADIHHPNLVKLYHLNRGSEAWFLTMEYVAGKDFRQKFGADASGTRESMQPANDTADPAAEDSNVRELLRVFYDLACGVHAIHRAGMLHRDLKPTNALIADTGRVVVLDFGLVREIEGDNLLTQDGTVAGTPAYMPPEQAMGEKLSEASDWYAFGAMLYEAISGVLPIESRNVTLLLQRKLKEDPAPLEHGAPPAVRRLCLALLARDPALRQHNRRTPADGRTRGDHQHGDTVRSRCRARPAPGTRRRPTRRQLRRARAWLFRQRQVRAGGAVFGRRRSFGRNTLHRPARTMLRARSHAVQGDRRHCGCVGRAPLPAR